MTPDLASPVSPLPSSPPAALPRTGGLAVCIPRIGPYHAARLQAASAAAAAAVTGEPALPGLTVIETRRTDAEYAWDEVGDWEGTPRRTLLTRSADLTGGDAAPALRQRMFDVLDEIRPAAVAVTGWSERDALAALEWAVERNVPAIMMSESQERDAPRRWIKERLKRGIVGTCSAALVGGTPHAEYIARLGMPADRILLGYDVVDNDWFARGAEAARQRAPELRTALGLPDRYFLASNRFIEKKNLDRLLAAFAHYRENAGPESWDLVLLGNGPLEETLRGIVRDLALERSVHFAGFRQYGDLPQFYGLAGAFVHASTTEQWGLVVNEAMAAGLPVLVSEACGCAQDLVRDGENGFRFDPFDVNGIAAALGSVAESPARREQMSEASRRIIADWSPRLFGESLWEAFQMAVAAPRRQRPWVSRPLLRLLAGRGAAS